jgi:hypothetical protein
MQGNIKTQYQSDPSNTTCPLVTDSRANPTAVGCGPGGNIGANEDDNTQTRLDLEWALGNHVLRAGLDYQDRDSVRFTTPAGGEVIVYNTLQPGAVLNINSSSVYTNNTGTAQDYVSSRIFVGGGPFSSELRAYYVEDEWQINDNFVAYIGARQDSLSNYGSTGALFADFDQDWAPRLGLSWDPRADGESKVYATWGRYYLPVANNTNYRVAAQISDTTLYSTFTGINSADGTPTGTAPITGDVTGSTQVNSGAFVTTVPTFQAAEADPFYKEEFILGYEVSLNDEYDLGLRYISRDVGTTLDDYCGFYAPNCVLVNPGKGGSWAQDNDGDGVPDTAPVFYSAEQIGLPKGVNEYTSAQMELKHATDRINWTLVYTWARSIGNFEGAVKSDIVQADAGITQDFDFPALMDGAYGYLPNDRRHAFKFFGNYGLTDKLRLGWNATAFTGRPRNQFGAGHPQGDDTTQFGSYGDTYYLFTNTCNLAGGGVGPCPVGAAQADKIYKYVPRGSAGRTPITMNLDVSLNYDFQFSGVDMTAGLKVYNILDFQEITNQNDAFEQRRSEGTLNQYYGAAYSWQAPRHYQLSLLARF